MSFIAEFGPPFGFWIERQNLARASSDLDLAAVSSQPQFQTSENSLKLAESLRSFVTIPSSGIRLKAFDHS